MEMSGPGDFVSDNLVSGGAVCGTPVAPATQETSSSGIPAKVFQNFLLYPNAVVG